MGILDDLKKEADKVRLDKEREEARLLELERIYQEGILPAMLKIHKYLIELLDQLSAVTWTINSDFYFPGLGNIENLQQKNYTISIDSQRNPKYIALRFECISPEEKRYKLANKEALNEASAFLQLHKVRFTDWAVRGGNQELLGYMLEARLSLKACILFEVDLENENILVTTINFQTSLEKSFSSHYSVINDAWLDQLGRYILRKENSFGQLDMTEAERERLKQLLEVQKKKNALDLEKSQLEATNEEGVLSKLNKILKKPIL